MSEKDYELTSTYIEIDEKMIKDLDNSVRKFLKDCDYSAIDCIHMLNQSFAAIFSFLNELPDSQLKKMYTQLKDEGNTTAIKCIKFSARLCNHLANDFLNK